MKRALTIAVSPQLAAQAAQHYGYDAALIAAALSCIEARFAGKRECLSSPNAVRDYLRLLLAPLPHEVFMALLLDAQNRLIAVEELFRGTLTQTSVYPREVVKLALRHNAAGIIFAHNHPCGIAEPSHADELITGALKHALALVDVKVLDHFIVAGSGCISFAERGIL